MKSSEPEDNQISEEELKEQLEEIEALRSEISETARVTAPKLEAVL